MSNDILHPLVQKALRTYDIQAKAIACDPALADTAAFCDHYGFAPEQSANAIIVASRTEPVQFFASLLLAHTKLDVNKKLRQLTGVRKLSFATAEQTVGLTDMLIGGVTLPGLPQHISIYIDAAVMEQPEVIIGGGNRSSKLILSPKELLKLPQVQIVPALALVR